MIHPKETAWFGDLDKDGNVIPMEQTTLYQEDTIGLKSLNEAGKAIFDSVVGEHLQFSMSYIKNIVIPVLQK